MTGPRETSPVGIAGYSAYVPWWRLDRAHISETLGHGGGAGTRAVASYDEDTTTMGVEAARRVVTSDVDIDALLFATTQPAYLDKSNAAVIHAALDLPPETAAFDVSGSIRSGAGALRWAYDTALTGRSSVAVLSDMRNGLPGGADESSGGDAAAALLFGTNDLIAEVTGVGCVTAEFMDRWRLPGDVNSHVWEERFGETIYLPLAEAAVGAALKDAGVTIGEIDHLVVGGLHARAVRRVPSRLGADSAVVRDELSTSLGNSGCANAAVLLAAVLDHADMDQNVLVLNLADGADAMVLRTTGLLGPYRDARLTTAAQAADGAAVDYARYLTWRGLLDREPPRRPDPQSPAAPPSFRHERWKFSLVGSRCLSCSTRHLPPNRVCFECNAADQMSDEQLGGVAATVATFTVDRLAFSPSPPLIAATVDFDGGGRFQCEMTEVAPDAVHVGMRVEMSFRRMYTSDGIHNYFWKARPLRA